MRNIITQLSKTIIFSLLVIAMFAACSKDEENKCAVTNDDYLGTYYGEYTFSVGGSKIKDTIVVTKNSDNKLDLYSHVMGSTIVASTNCEKFNIETFTGVSFDLGWANVLDATGSGNGQYDNQKIKVAIKFSVVVADIGTGPAEYKNMIDLTGDFSK